jgi:hypothetical protein
MMLGLRRRTIAVLWRASGSLETVEVVDLCRLNMAVGKCKLLTLGGKIKHFSLIANRYDKKPLILLLF